MKKIFFILLIPFFFFITLKRNCQLEQDSTKLYRIETNDGNEYIGNIILKNSDTIRFKTTNIGVITISQKDIVKLKEILKEQIVNGAVWYENIQSTRYFWAPNGYGLQKGEAYYQNMWILYNQTGYGFTDNFSIGAGMLPLFLFGGAPTPLWITPKFSIPIKKDKVNLGIGVLAATVAGVSDASFGIAYGVSTFGSRDKNITVGIGYGYAGGDWAKSPIIMASSMLRTGKKGYFITENYFINTNEDIMFISMIGGRSLISKVGLDYGLVIPISSSIEQFVAIPWIGITIPIQSK